MNGLGVAAGRVWRALDWCWSGVRQGVRQALLPLTGPVERAVDRLDRAADLELADTLERAGLGEAADRLRQQVAARAAGGGRR